MNKQSSNRDQRLAAVSVDNVFLPDPDSRPTALRPVTLWVVTLFWTAQFGTSTLSMQLTAPEFAMISLLPRALVGGAGVVITLMCIILQDRRRSARLGVRGSLAIAFTLVSAAVLSAFNYLAFEILADLPNTSGFWLSLSGGVLSRVWVFGSVYAIWLAISYWTAVHEREEEIAVLKALAQDAQLRALRSQLNPHFLFNALNSITALIEEGRSKQAEETTENLSDFLRITLSLDPQRLITLGEEASLQKLFLEIQQVRFPTRLQVEFDVAADVEDALVPNLILQPLVENSIKYAVARSTAPVTLRIVAKTAGDKLHILVEDDAGNAASSAVAKGNRMGLSNVTQRLFAHFGEEAKFTYGPGPSGGFSNSILIPLCRAS